MKTSRATIGTKRQGVSAAVVCAVLAACNSSATLDAGTDATVASTDVAVTPDVAVSEAATDVATDASITPDSAMMDAGPRVYPMPMAANAVGPTDPRWEGQYRFLYDAWGTEILDEWPPADFMVHLIESEPDVFGNQFASFGFIPDPHDDLPYGFKRGLVDPTKTHETCAMCHVAELPDHRVWFGAPNTVLDVGRFRLAVDQRWVASGHPSLFDAVGRAKEPRLGPGRFHAETGSYPDIVPADFPPYWNLSQRTHLNYLGTGQNVRTEAFFAIFSFGAGDPTDATARVRFPLDSSTDPFLAFFGTFDPPAAPAGDAAMIARGQQVYDTARCGSCHHVGNIGMDGIIPLDRTPGGHELMPGDDSAFPLGTIRTNAQHHIIQDGDPNVDAGASGGMDDGILNLIRFISAHHLSVSISNGYTVSDLRGLTYTAPYLHNGSVPTLEDLLQPASQRPTSFVNHGFTVDTTQYPNGNEGHEFGTTLSDADKTALVAYLRSL